MIAEADEILRLVQRLLITHLELGVAELAFRAFDGRGVFIEAPDEDDDDRCGPGPTRSIVRVQVDRQRVLEEAVGTLGYATAAGVPDFMRLCKPSLPTSVSVFFLEKALVPPHAILPLVDSAKLTIVVHVSSSVTAKYNKFALPLGLYVMRLRDLASLTDDEITRLAVVAAGVRGSVGGQFRASDVTALAAQYKEADPLLVEEYATAQQDRLFEAATAKIMEPLVGHILVLGGRFSGRPVPDGLLFQDEEVAAYDCKSKDDTDYRMAPQDADQQQRYLEIQKRLGDSRPAFRGRGVVLFSPRIDPREFEEQTRKEFWARLGDDGYKLLVMPASSLRRLHELTAGEQSTFGLYFNCKRFWRALFDFELSGLLPAQQAMLLGDRGRRHRLLDDEAVELAWLSGLSEPVAFIATVASALQRVDPGSTIADKVRRPRVVQRHFKELRAANPTIASLAKATGLSAHGVSYLLLSSEFRGASEEELGENGVSNARRLRREADSLVSAPNIGDPTAALSSPAQPGTNLARPPVRTRSRTRAAPPLATSSVLQSAAQQNVVPSQGRGRTRRNP